VRETSLVKRTEFIGAPDSARVVTRRRRVRLGDAAPSGTVRLDALARYLQDIADDDVEEAGVPGLWVIRRLTMDFGELPCFRDALELSTFCSGIGPRWAERRTTVRIEDAPEHARAAVEAVALWVHIDEQGKPSPLDRSFIECYGADAAARVVRTRLHHPAVRDAADREPWAFRVSDLDVLGHVNNAAMWSPAEEHLSAEGVVALTGAEIEYRAPIGSEEAVTLHSLCEPGTLWCWLTVDGTTRASLRVDFAQS